METNNSAVRHHNVASTIVLFKFRCQEKLKNHLITATDYVITPDIVRVPQLWQVYRYQMDIT